tara:strand:+ start:135 stop:671 length:537 start_codon:yes stop_codon:yes gene_type:complete
MTSLLNSLSKLTSLRQEDCLTGVESYSVWRKKKVKSVTTNVLIDGLSIRTIVTEGKDNLYYYAEICGFPHYPVNLSTKLGRSLAQLLDALPRVDDTVHFKPTEISRLIDRLPHFKRVDLKYFSIDDFSEPDTWQVFNGLPYRMIYGMNYNVAVVDFHGVRICLHPESVGILSANVKVK